MSHYCFDIWATLLSWEQQLRLGEAALSISWCSSEHVVGYQEAPRAALQGITPPSHPTRQEGINIL